MKESEKQKIRDQLEAMTDQERVEVIQHFCNDCGSKRRMSYYQGGMVCDCSALETE